MHFFLFLNDLARRWPFLDETLRYFFVAGVPLIGTILLAQLTLFWPANSNSSRTKFILATLVAIGFGALLMIGIEFISHALHLGNISTRPYMTRRVNLLIVEPQDNSFPSPELIVAAIFSFASWMLSKRWGALTSVLVVLLGITRMMCGTNYLADVVFGAVFGVAFCALTFSIFKVSTVSQVRAWQSGLSLATFGTALVGIFLIASGEPRFASKLAAPWNSPALATSKGDNHEHVEETADAAPMSDEDAQNEAKTLALSKRSSLYLPEVETYLRGKLAPAAKPFSLLDIEVAPVTTGDSTSRSAYRVAAIRFEVQQDIPDLRRQTVECGARLAKETFALDSQIENVDIAAVMRGDATVIDGSMMHFVGGEVPVFTASIQRKNLIIEGNEWANSPTIDGGSWLRFRSRIYLNQRVLPEDPKAKQEPKAPVLAGGKL